MKFCGKIFYVIASSKNVCRLGVSLLLFEIENLLVQAVQ